MLNYCQKKALCHTLSLNILMGIGDLIIPFRNTFHNGLSYWLIEILIINNYSLITKSAQYLEALHEANVANQDHTTLLLNCYTKLKNVQKLEQFIRSDGQLNFDVETAIKVTW